jgi:uncharacterized membrane protein YeaQ/YmgE (transglycosylase-associated protein family)
MSILELIVYLVIAGICGSVARALAGGTSGGFIVSVLVGFLGAFVGTWMARAFRLPEFFAVDIGGHPFPIVWSVLGGVVLVALTHFLTRPRSSYMGRWQARH